MASGIELFRLMAKLVMDTSEFDKGVEGAKEKAEGLGGAFSGAESKVTKFSSALNVMGKIGGAATNVVKGVVNAGLGLVETSASMDALRESSAKAFEGIESDADAAFSRVSEANNIAMLRLQDSGLAFFRQFTSAGADSTEALAGMEKMLMLAADGAAAYDKSLEDVASMMRSFTRGNVEAGEAIGLFINQTTREELAGTLFDGKKWDELTEKERQFALMHHINATYLNSDVLGQGAREMNNWSNVVGNLSSAWTKAQATMGDEIRVALIPALQELTQWVQDNPDLWKGLGETFGRIATAGAQMFQSLIEFISRNEDKIIGFIDSLNFLLSGGNSAEFTNKGRPQGTEEEKRAAALAYLTGEGLYSDVERVFGGKNAATRYLTDKFNSTDGEITKEVAAQWVDEAMAELQKEVDAANITAKVNMQPDFSGFFSVLGNIVSAGANWFFGNRPGEGQGVQFNAKGLAYVPYDNYLTHLHRGESVLNRVEAEDWRAAKRGENMGFDPAVVGDAVKAALAGVSISMDGRTVGALVTPYVSREQAAEAWRRR